MTQKEKPGPHHDTLGTLPMTSTSTAIAPKSRQRKSQALTTITRETTPTSQSYPG